MTQLGINLLESFDSAWVDLMPLPARSWLLNVAGTMSQSFEAQAAKWRAVEAVLSNPVVISSTNSSENGVQDPSSMTDNKEDSATASLQSLSLDSEASSVADSDSDLKFKSLDVSQSLDLKAFTTEGETNDVRMSEETSCPDVGNHTLNYLTLDRPLFKREKCRISKTGPVLFDRSERKIPKKHSYSSASMKSLIEEMTKRRAASKDTARVIEGESSGKPQSNISIGEIAECQPVDNRKQSHLSDTSHCTNRLERDRTELECENNVMQEEGNENNAMQEGNENNVMQEGNENNVMQEGNENNVMQEGNENNVMQEGNENNVMQEGNENNVMQEEKHCSLDLVPNSPSQSNNSSSTNAEAILVMTKDSGDCKDSRDVAAVPGACWRCGCTCFENNHYSQGRCMNCFHKHEMSA